MSDPYWPIDHNLVSTFASNHRTVVIPDSGLATRLSMVYWATRDERDAVFVTPKAMHAGIRRDMDRYMKVNGRAPDLNIVTPQWAAKNLKPEQGRVAVETTMMGPKFMDFVESLVSSKCDIVFRFLSPSVSRHGPTLEFFRKHGFTVVSYTLSVNVRNDLTPAIHVIL